MTGFKKRFHFEFSKNKLDNSSVILWEIEIHRVPFMHILAHILITLSFTLNVGLSWCPA